MKIYNVIWQDRHSDTTAKPFLNKEKAVEYARVSAKSVCRFPEDYKEIPTFGNEYLFYIRYSCEGDCIWVTEHELNQSNKCLFN